MPHSVYILASHRRALTLGLTRDLAARAAADRERLVYVEEHADVSEAVARMRQIRTWTRERQQAFVEAANPTWQDLDDARPASMPDS